MLSWQLRRLLNWIRFGSITSEIKSIDGGVVSERAYYGRGGVMIGYYAYGYWDPAMPYKGK